MSKTRRQDRTRPHGRGYALTAFMLGVLVSVGANVAELWHPSPAALARAGVTAEQWRPELGAMIMSAFYPLALMLTVEILSRVEWPRATGWAVIRYAGAGAVGLVAAVVSYGHMSALLRAYGEDRLTASVGPIAVDGMMLVSGFALLAISRTSSATVDVPAPAVEVPAVPAPVDVPAVPESVSAEVPSLALVEPAAAPIAPAAPRPHLVKAAHLFGAEITGGTVPGIRRIKDTLKVGQPRAQEVQRYLETLAQSTA